MLDLDSILKNLVEVIKSIKNITSEEIEELNKKKEYISNIDDRESKKDLIRYLAEEYEAKYGLQIGYIIELLNDDKP
ncbi:hypothetical protein [Prevotella melaninogenica]|uniref:hypothetical protein n=1 Tax=Prevotella melaninogenica TaxID=28132 RepID=UPI001BA6391E|nr:hypothetical protein [Prevotella melaninogenica]QUB65682.1 hypothetical protein J5A57_00790 [Prevotella melaninogenica]